MDRTVVGFFDDYDDAQKAVDGLQGAGFAYSDISVISNNADARFGNYDTTTSTAGSRAGHVVGGAVGGAAEGAVIGGLTGLAASLALLLIPGIGPIAAIGPLAATLSGAGIGAVGGGVIGGLTGLGIPEEAAGYYAEGIRRGGTLIAVKTDDTRATEAARILRRYGAVRMQERSSYYRSTGYTGWRNDMAPYTPDQIAAERANWATARRNTATTVSGNTPADVNATQSTNY
jgi:hypothetical protein